MKKCIFIKIRLCLYFLKLYISISEVYNATLLYKLSDFNSIVYLFAI